MIFISSEVAYATSY